VADLWKVLGYDEIAGDIAHALDASAGIKVLEGPPGVGKSWLARGIGALWEHGGGSTVVAQGDSTMSDIDLYPFGFAMAGLPSGWARVAPAAEGVAKVAETLLGTAGIITTIIQGLAATRQGLRHRRTIFLGEREQEVLYDLERLSRKKPILLSADNLHWWDRASLNLLRMLYDPRMYAALPFLIGARVLAVQTPPPYQQVANPDAHEALLSTEGTTRLELRRIPREGFADVLVALGATPRPSSQVTDAVYSLSGGHLALARRASVRLAAGEAQEFLAAAHTDAFVRMLLSDRIRSLGDLGKKAVDLLQVAAALGLTFRRDELVCASDGGDTETSRLLRLCRDEELLELSDGIGRFVHDLYRGYFLEAGDLDSVGIHERLSDCLRVLRPAEYDLRCLNAIAAERAIEAGTFGVLMALQRQREGRPSNELPQEIVEIVRAGGMRTLVDRFASALTDLKSYRFGECLAGLDRLPRDMTKPLQAEADYLRAMCLMSTRSEVDRGEGRALLATWSGYEDEEPELGCRLARLRLYGLAMMVDKQPARELEGRIRQLLIERVSFDVSARDELYAMDRCAGSLYWPDISLVRNREAAAHFGPVEDEAVIRRPVEYYRCLVNLGSSLISNARYDEARHVYDDVERLVAAYPDGVFPRPDYPRMNLLLAQYRAGEVDAPSAVDRQRAIATSLKSESDPFYVDNALAVYLALAGSATDAVDIFDGLEATLVGDRRDPEPSMVYLIGANRCGARFLSGDVPAAQAEWDALTGVVNRIAYPIQPILLRRHELLAEVFATAGAMSPRDFDEYLVVHSPDEFGPLWNNFGRGFRMPEVEFWREN
jgi:hypothetical protein